MEKVKLTEPTTQPIYNNETLPIVHHPHHPHHPHQTQYPASQVANVTKSNCEAYMHRYVEIQAADGCCYDGIVEYVDEEWICLAVPGAVDDLRGFFTPPPFYPPYGPFFPYRPRRFNRLVLPLLGLAAVSLLPYYW